MRNRKTKNGKHVANSSSLKVIKELIRKKCVHIQMLLSCSSSSSAAVAVAVVAVAVAVAPVNQ